MSKNVKEASKDKNHLVIEVPKRKRPFEMPPKPHRRKDKMLPREQKHKGELE